MAAQCQPQHAGKKWARLRACTHLGLFRSSTASLDDVNSGPLTALLHDCLAAMGEQFAYAEVWSRERISSRRGRGVGGVAFRRGKDHEKTQSERDQVRSLLSGALCIQCGCWLASHGTGDMGP